MRDCYTLALAGGRLAHTTIVDTGTVRATCQYPHMCVMFWSTPKGVLQPSMGAGAELHEPIGIGLRYKMLRLVNGQQLLFRYFCKVVPGIPFDLVGDEDLALADIKAELNPVVKNKTKTMIMTLRHLTGTSGSICRKVSGLHVLRESPLDLQQLRVDLAKHTDSFRVQAAQQFGVNASSLVDTTVKGNDYALRGDHSSIIIDGAVLLNSNGKSMDGGTRTNAKQSGAKQRLPLRHMQALFGHPGTKTMQTLARMVDAKVDQSSDKHRSAVNETSNARPKGLKPTHTVSREQFTLGSDQILDHLGEKHRPDHKGNKYILGHLDMFSHLRTYTFHKSKKAADAYRGLRQHVKQHRLPVETDKERFAQNVRIRTDGSSSFKGDFDSHLEQVGASHWKGSAYVHDTQLLNHIEVSHQHVEHKARVAMAQCADLWKSKGLNVYNYNTNAVANMAHACNYMPTAWHDGRPPIEFQPGRGGSKINLAELRQQFPTVFGSLAWQVLPLDKRSAMTRPHPVEVGRVKQWVDRGRPCFYLGITPDNRYILLDILTREIYYTVTAKFSVEGIDFGYSIGDKGPSDHFDETDWMQHRAMRTDVTDWGPAVAAAPRDDDDQDDDFVPGWAPELPAVAAPPVQPPGVPQTPQVPPQQQQQPTAPSSSSRPTRQANLNSAAKISALYSDHCVIAQEDGTVTSVDSDDQVTDVSDIDFGDPGFQVPLDLALAVKEDNAATFYYDNGEPAFDPEEPRTLSEALDGPMSEAWAASWQREIDGVGDRLQEVVLDDWLRDNPGKRPLYSTVVVKCKRDENNRINVLKSRLCAIGTPAVKGRDWHEKACATPRRGTINLLECLGQELGWSVHVTDLQQAFLQGVFQDNQSGKQLLRLPKRLRRYTADGRELAFSITAPIYGLIDSANQLSRTQKQWIESDDNPVPMRRSNFDYGLYSLYVPQDPVRRRKALSQLKKFGITAEMVDTGKAALHVLTWIDDNKIFSSHDNMRDAFLAAFKKRFKTKDLGHGDDPDLRNQPPTVYLANTYTYADGRVDIGNSAMAERILAQANLDGSSKSHPSPMKGRPTLPEPREQTSGEKAALLAHLRKHKEKFVVNKTTFEEVCTQYRSLLMSISYLAQSLHLELVVHVSILAQYQTFVCIESWSALKHLLRHLLSIKSETVTFVRTGAKNIHLTAECDASFGADVPWHGGSRYGVLLRINRQAAFEVEAKRTKTCCIGTMGAELFGMSQACRSIEFYRNFLAELKHVQTEPTPLACDNRSAILTSESKTNSHKSRHLSLRYLYVQECVIEHKTVCLVPTKTTDLSADILTKPKEGREYFINKWKIKKGLHTAPPTYK